MNTSNRANNFVLQDSMIIVASILIAVLLAKTHFLADILTSTRELKFIGSFISGIFFTSVFTTAPAMVALGEIAQTHSLALTALVGAFGAMLGDLIIFRFIRDRLSEHVAELIKHEEGGKRVKALLRLKFFRWLTFFAGGLIIASPLPDELGIALLGFSKMKTSGFIPLSFVFNFIGIFFIGAVARTL